MPEYPRLLGISQKHTAITAGPHKLTGVNDGQGTHPVVFTTGCTKFDVISAVMVDTGLGQHGIVLNLRFPRNRKLWLKENELHSKERYNLHALLTSCQCVQNKLLTKWSVMSMNLGLISGLAVRT